jgi:hypothetical protein
MIKEGYEKKGQDVPLWSLVFLKVFNALSKDKRVKLYVNLFNFLWIFIIPIWYYGLVRGTYFKLL